MEERRKAKRMDLQSTITVKRIDNGKDEEVSIDIKDLSKSGMGFNCKQELEEGAIYQSSIVIWTQEVIPALLKIVRKLDRGENGYFYGAQLNKAQYSLSAISRVWWKEAAASRLTSISSTLSKAQLNAFRISAGISISSFRFFTTRRGLSHPRLQYRLKSSKTSS